MVYKPQLDGLRAVAVAAVAWSHWERPYQFGIPFGAGVHLFYVLSGFLITGILLSLRDQVDRGAAVKAFYIRRAFRIFPAFYATLAVAWWASVPWVRETLAWHAGYLTNVLIFATEEWPGSISHFWSLAVEEQFYLLWPWLIVFAPRRWLMPAVIGVIGAAVLFRWWLALLGYRETLHAVLLPGSLDSLGVGALLAIVSAHGGRPTAYGKVLVATAFVVWMALLVADAAASPIPLMGIAIKQTLQAVVFGWCVWQAANGFSGWIGRLLASSPLVYVGKISYGVYLVHGFAGALLWGLFGLNSREMPEPWRLLALVGITLSIAMLSWHAMEAPVNNLKRFFPYRALGSSHSRTLEPSTLEPSNRQP